MCDSQPKCSFCKKSVARSQLAFTRCLHCRENFCMKHRVPESHNCDLDASERQKDLIESYKLAMENSKVKSSTLDSTFS